jgi:hypothetical protein
MKILVTTLRAIVACEEIQPADYLTDGDQDELHELIQTATAEASGTLITSLGTPNYAAIARLAQEGFLVTKGESDSFGWLTGVIHTAKGKIMYG